MDSCCYWVLCLLLILWFFHRPLLDGIMYVGEKVGLKALKTKAQLDRGNTIHLSNDLGKLRIQPTIDIGALKKVKYKRVAVVGSGGILQKYKLGKEIDAMDAVFRFNDAPVIGFEDMVGSKTTFRCSFGVECGRFVREENVICYHDTSGPRSCWQAIQNDQKLHHFRYPNAIQKPTSQWYTVPETNNAVEMTLDQDSLDWRQATTGFKTILVAMLMAEEVYIYGFSAGLSLNKQREFTYHYYEEQPLPGYQTNSTPFHNYSVEGKMIQHLIQHQHIANRTP